MKRIVCKFGGTSLADASQFEKVRDIIARDPSRKIIVVSAPGKRHKDDPKITDLLYLAQETAELKGDVSASFDQIRDRFLTIERDLGLDPVLAPVLSAFEVELTAGVSKDYAASRGEYFSGLLMASLLGAEFIDPRDYVVIDAFGRTDPVTYEALGDALAEESKTYVMPGFYGRDHQGRVKTFSRGGSDVSGAVAARAGGADVYENWTDVSGLLMADPRVVDSPCHMDQVTYKEIRELSYMGASVFHDEAILPVREVGIPINIRNTNAPDDAGTMIVPAFTGSKYKIAGIAGKQNFSMIGLEKGLMNKEVGFGYKVLQVLSTHNVSYEHCPSSIDTMSVILEHDQIAGKEELILEELKQAVSPDKIELTEGLALIAIVGEEMTNTIGMASVVFSALAEAKVNVRVINQGASELNIIVGVAEADYAPAVRALYHAFLDVDL
ncbi:MAG: aspartate kinase [Lentisphaeria bacterium]|nr:aspartate kinase [Lentisphaeria bacterium]